MKSIINLVYKFIHKKEIDCYNKTYEYVKSLSIENQKFYFRQNIYLRNKLQEMDFFDTERNAKLAGEVAFDYKRQFIDFTNIH